jgi:phosphoribosyl 1,2-cyclic phosphate phosphodiesterase
MLKITLLGTGTSQGCPMIGCRCKACKSKNKKDNRLRTSAHIQYGDLSINIDCGADFRQQMLQHSIRHLNAVLLTHSHFDHIGGLDDTRPLIHNQQHPLDIYGNKATLDNIREIFSYAFASEHYPGAPVFVLHEIGNDDFYIKNLKITPIKVMHGVMDILGYRFADVAYLTDVKSLLEEEIHKIKNVKVLIVNALRIKKQHFSHLILPDALQLIKKINPERCYLTHISHDMGLHEEFRKHRIKIPKNVHLGYDGLNIST